MSDYWSVGRSGGPITKELLVQIQLHPSLYVWMLAVGWRSFLIGCQASGVIPPPRGQMCECGISSRFNVKCCAFVERFYRDLGNTVRNMRESRRRSYTLFIRGSVLVLSLFGRLHRPPWRNVSWRRFPSKWWSTTATEPSPPCALWRTYGRPSSALWPPRQRSEGSACFRAQAAADGEEESNQTSQTDACYGILDKDCENVHLLNVLSLIHLTPPPPSECSQKDWRVRGGQQWSCISLPLCWLSRVIRLWRQESQRSDARRIVFMHAG